MMKPEKSSNQTIYMPAPLWRRLAALIYDIFVVFSLMILFSALALILNQGRSFLPIQSIFLIYLFTATGLSLSWFWHRSGQTLGMLAWKIKLLNHDDSQLTWPKAFLRYCVAFPSLGFAGIGLIWCLFDKQKQSLYDKVVKTKMIYVHSRRT